MQTIQVREKTGADGVLNLRIPLGLAETECEVTVVVQPKSTESRKPTPEELGWPPGFFDQVVGKWQGEFERPPQGEFEERDDL
jgi:hypothetical protein